MVGAPEVWLRERGPRRLEEVPPREIAEFARRLRDENGRELDGTELARAVLAAYGWQRMAPSLVAWVEDALDRYLH